MSDATSPLPALDVSATWGSDLIAVLCERCDWRYLLPRAQTTQGLPYCPHCFQARLTPVEQNLPEMPHPYPPEMVAPFALSDAALEAAIQGFAKGIPFAPKDLNFTAIRKRLTPLYLPMWLADSRVCAHWQAEAGFNYQVVSHQEQFQQDYGGWRSKQVKENRVRWEQRVGQLERTYQNVSAPALEEARALRQQVGDFDTQKTVPYDPRYLERAWVRLPDRSTQDTWSEAAAGFQQWAANECQQACAADHMRSFRWKAEFADLNWTLLLLPTYTTYYLDDENKPQPVLIHGQTGQITGTRRASMKRAQQTGLVILIVALVLAVLGLVFGALSVTLPVLAPLAIIALVFGLPGLLAALIPIGIAWDFNRKK